MQTNDPQGIYVVSVTPQAPALPDDPQAEISFCVRMRIVAFGQEAYFNIDVPARGFDYAVQCAYLRLTHVTAGLHQLAQQVGDALARRLGIQP